MPSTEIKKEDINDVKRANKDKVTALKKENKEKEKQLKKENKEKEKKLKKELKEKEKEDKKKEKEGKNNQVLLKPYQELNKIELGIDEAGRGCLFGDLFVAGVIFPKNIQELINIHKVVIKDSKKDVSVVKWYYRYISFLDARARSIDFLLLLLIIDKVFVYNLSELFLILSMALVLRAVLMYVAGIYSAFKADKLGLDV